MDKIHCFDFETRLLFVYLFIGSFVSFPLIHFLRVSPPIKTNIKNAFTYGYIYIFIYFPLFFFLHFYRLHFSCPKTRKYSIIA